MKPAALVALSIVAIAAATLTAQQKGKAKPGPQLKFEVKQLHKDNSEGIAVGDIDGDGKLDVVAGEFWYQAPEFKQFPVRKLMPFGADYLQNNSEHLLDVDGD
ncbi:MAG: VCBS repeat-containing protein, partial [Verrucomicrobiota bacterium]